MAARPPTLSPIPTSRRRDVLRMMLHPVSGRDDTAAAPARVSDIRLPHSGPGSRPCRASCAGRRATLVTPGLGWIAVRRSPPLDEQVQRVAPGGVLARAFDQGGGGGS